MDGTRTRGRRLMTAAAVAILAGLPLAAFAFAPDARAAAPSGPPGSALGGINTAATASAIQLVPYVPGVVGAGDVSKGDFVQVSLPYASSTMSTGPSLSSQSAPAWPGPTAAGLGTALSTFSSQFPPQFVSLLNDHAQAQADYPPQAGTGASGSYAPPGGAQTGAAPATARASGSGTSSSSGISDSTLAGQLEVASATSDTNAVLGAASATTEALTTVGTVSLLGGKIQISGLSSQATATSSGNAAQQSSDLKVGQVTVAGLAATIGPNGIQLNKTSLGNPLLVTAANEVLAGLKQAGISVTTLAPSESTSGGVASVTSGALQIIFADDNIPNPGQKLPVGSSVGLEIDLGISQANANATPLPPLPPFPGLPAATPPPLASSAPPVSTGGGSFTTPGHPAYTETLTQGGSSPQAAGSSPSLASPPSSGASGAPSNQSSPLQMSPIDFAGLPVRTAWVVAALLLSIVAAGPLLAYANWQLLRGRRS